MSFFSYLLYFNLSLSFSLSLAYYLLNLNFFGSVFVFSCVQVAYNLDNIFDFKKDISFGNFFLKTISKQNCLALKKWFVLDVSFFFVLGVFLCVFLGIDNHFLSAIIVLLFLLGDKKKSKYNFRFVPLFRLVLIASITFNFVLSSSVLSASMSFNIVYFVCLFFSAFLCHYRDKEEDLQYYLVGYNYYIDKVYSLSKNSLIYISCAFILSFLNEVATAFSVLWLLLVVKLWKKNRKWQTLNILSDSLCLVPVVFYYGQGSGILL